jgi:hypothetical protein
MKGTWSASTSLPTGAPQEQVNGAISFPLPLNEKLNVEHTKYLNEIQTGTPGSVIGCNGSVNEPEAEAGFLCVYTGMTATTGCLEKEWKNAKFVAITDPAGNQAAGTTNLFFGAEVVFRTIEFTEIPTTLKAPASLCTGGSWAVTEAK